MNLFLACTTISLFIHTHKETLSNYSNSKIVLVFFVSLLGLSKLLKNQLRRVRMKYEPSAYSNYTKTKFSLFDVEPVNFPFSVES